MAAAAFSVAVRIGLEIDLADFLADRIAEFGNVIANRRGPFELQSLGRRVHFRFQFANVFFGDVLRLIGPPHGGIGPRVGRRFSLDAVADGLDDRRRRDIVLAVILLLYGPAAMSFINGILHRIGDRIGV